MGKRKERIERRRQREQDVYDAEMAHGALAAVRAALRDGLGWNSTWVDEDAQVLIALSQRAVLAGLATDCGPDVLKRFVAAAEKHRAEHERALARPLGPTAVAGEVMKLRFLLAELADFAFQTEEEWQTHAHAWRRGLVIALDVAAEPTEDTDERGYWQHEINALDRLGQWPADIVAGLKARVDAALGKVGGGT